MKKDTAQALMEFSEKEYNAYASEFSDTRKYFWRELEFLKDYVRSGDKVLDVGCGNGRLVDVFEGVGVEYVGIDSSKELITIAQHNRSKYGTFVHGNALALPFKENTFDAVFSIAVLHHIPSKENRTQFVAEIYRALKPGGVCVLTTWNILQLKFLKAHILHTVKKVCGFSEMDFGDLILTFGKEKRKRYVHALRKKDVENLFNQQNFSKISICEIQRKSGYANFVAVATK